VLTSHVLTVKKHLDVSCHLGARACVLWWLAHKRLAGMFNCVLTPLASRFMLGFLVLGGGFWNLLPAWNCDAPCPSCAEAHAYCCLCYSTCCGADIAGMCGVWTGCTLRACTHAGLVPPTAGSWALLGLWRLNCLVPLWCHRCS
jgi:hypothetical protein